MVAQMLTFLRLGLAVVVLTAGPARAQDGAALMKQAEAAVTTDLKRAETLVEAARAAYARARGEGSVEVALADYRLALVRALGGDRAGELPRMIAAAGRVADRARAPEERTLAAQALIVAASFTMVGGDPAVTDRLRDAALTILRDGNTAETTDLAEACRVASDVLSFQNRLDAALEWSDRSVALYRRLDSAGSSLVYALTRRGAVLQRLSRYPEALADLRRAVAQADLSARDDPVVMLTALRALGNYHWRLGEPALALPLLRRALAEAQKLPPGFPYAGGLSRDLMTVLLDANHSAEARRYADETAARARSTLGPSSYEYASALLVLARIDTDERAYEAAARRIDEADAIFATALRADNSRRFEVLAARGALLAATGRAAEAAALYQQAGDLLASLPPDDLDRIDVAHGTATAFLADAHADRSWPAARAAADGLTTRIVRQVSGLGALDANRGRTDRVFTGALDSAWARQRGFGR